MQDKPQYICVGKIAYPDTKDPVMDARKKDDPDWPSYLAMETIVQETGRCTRKDTDLAEVGIFDDNWIWYYPRFKHFAPKYFQARVRGSKTCVPDPEF
jgi:Rad3-related DNA helicase